MKTLRNYFQYPKSVQQRSRSLYATALPKLFRQPKGLFGIIVLIILILTAVLPSFFAPYDPTIIFYDSILTPPDFNHFLGTDEIGRDILSRLIYGSQITLQVVLFSIIMAVIVGSVFGMVAGYLGGWVDDLIMRIMDGMMSFPMLILALAIISALGPSVLNAMIAISVINVPGFARMVRGQVLILREMEFVQAATALGAGSFRIMFRHIFPSLIGNLIIYSSLRSSVALITESVLSFLGLSAQPPTPTWGIMLSTAMEYWDTWWMSVFPGACIFVAVLALNFLGDALRDALDVRLTD